MEYVHLGRSGLLVSRLCLGTMNFGPFTNEQDSHMIMDKSIDVGINFFDTANTYGREMGKGLTETIIGAWFAKGGGRREKIVLATKVFGRVGEGPNDRRLSAYHIRRACEDSLRRLQTDHIDLYQMHHVDRDTPWEEVWQAFEILVQQGKALYVGSSNFAGWQLVHAQRFASMRNFLGLVSEQSLYNLASRVVELEVIPACRVYGLALLPWSPLAGGLLSGILENRQQGRRNSERIQQSFEKQRNQIEAYEAFCRESNLSPVRVALAWLLANPQVTSPIIGPRTMEQLDECVKALDVSLSGEALERLDQIWPGPGGEAPEAYAW